MVSPTRCGVLQHAAMCRTQCLQRVALYHTHGTAVHSVVPQCTAVCHCSVPQCHAQNASSHALEAPPTLPQRLVSARRMQHGPVDVAPRSASWRNGRVRSSDHCCCCEVPLRPPGQRMLHTPPAPDLRQHAAKRAPARPCTRQQLHVPEPLPPLTTAAAWPPSAEPGERAPAVSNGSSNLAAAACSPNALHAPGPCRWAAAS
jgi:hypothetical protein